MDDYAQHLVSSVVNTEKLGHFACACQSFDSSSSFNANQQQIHEMQQQLNGSLFNPNCQ